MEIKDRLLKKILRDNALSAAYPMSTTSSITILLCENKKKEKYLLKFIRRRTDAKKYDSLAREIKIHSFFKKYRSGDFMLPKKIVSKVTPSYALLIYSFIEGTPLSGWYHTTFTHKLSGEEMEKIIKCLKFLHKLTKKKEYLGYDLEARGYKENSRMFRRYLKKADKIAPKSLLKKAAEKLEKNKGLFDKAEKVVAHGDLSPKNILLVRNDIALIDFSDIHLNNKCFDPAFLSLAMWNDPDMQKRFIGRYLKEFPECRELLYLDMIVMMPKFMVIIKDTEKGVKDNYDEGLIMKGSMRRALKHLKDCAKYQKEFLKRII